MMSSANEAARNDRTEEFLRLYGKHDRAIFTYLLALVLNWADADDLAQETRLRLWQQFDRYEPGSDFGAWARTVAYYVVLAHREKASRNRLRFGQACLDSVAAECAAMPELLRQRQEALVGCMEKLDLPRRELIEEYYGSGESLREIAERLGRSYDATRKAVYRAQIALADCINSELGRKEPEE
jgi:RNA polymerase sigma-70 factor, ECF subfamily